MHVQLNGKMMLYELCGSFHHHIAVNAKCYSLFAQYRKCTDKQDLQLHLQYVCCDVLYVCRGVVACPQPTHSFIFHPLKQHTCLLVPNQKPERTMWVG